MRARDHGGSKNPAERNKIYERNEVVRSTPQHKRSRNSCQIVRDLHVGPPEEWEEQEDF